MSKKPSTLIQSLIPVSRSTKQYENVPTDDSQSIADSSNHGTVIEPSTNHEQDPYFHRNITFTRGFTAFDAAASFRRTFTHTLGIQVDDDADEIWTQQLLDTYNIAQTKGVEGDIPLPAEFARNIEFWKTMLLTGLIASILGFVSLFFLNVVDYIPKVWANNWHATADDTYFKCPNCEVQDGCVCDKYLHCGFNDGQLYWIGVTTFTGFLVGLLRYLIQYPDDLPGLFKEIATYHVEPKWSPASFLLSIISLAGGMSLGPEQALASIGGGLATFVSEHYVTYQDQEYKKLLVLGGMASALGALFPTPILGVLMLVELAKLPKTHMESTLVMSCGACVSFMVYYAIVDDTYIESMSSHGAVFALKWDFDESHCFTAFVIGIICAALGIVVMLSIGITKQIMNRIRLRLQHNKLLASLIPTMISGCVIGTINYALPLTIGNGNQVMSPMIAFTLQHKLSNSLLICSGFAKIFTLGMSMNGGFVGGFVFPIITVATMAGLVTSKIYPSLPVGLCLGCYIGGLPAAVCPMPFTLAGLAIFIFYFGLYQTFPIFLSCIVSYTLVVGSGLFGALQRRATQAEGPRLTGAEQQQQNKIMKEKIIEDVRAQENKRAEEQFAFEQYYLAKNGHATRSNA